MSLQLTATDRIGSSKSTERQTNVSISRPSLQNRLLCKKNHSQLLNVLHSNTTVD